MAIGIDQQVPHLNRDLKTIQSCITWMTGKPNSDTNHLTERLSTQVTDAIDRIGVSTFAQSCKANDVELLQSVASSFKEKQEKGVFKTVTLKRIFRKSVTEAHLEKLVGKIQDVLIELLGDNNGRVLVLQGNRGRLDEILGELIRDNTLASLNEQSRQVLLQSILENKGQPLAIHEQFLEHLLNSPSFVLDLAEQELLQKCSPALKRKFEAKADSVIALLFDKGDSKKIGQIAEKAPGLLRNWIEAHKDKSATRFSQLLQLQKAGVPHSPLKFFVQGLLREVSFIPVLDKYIDQEMERNGHQPALLDRNVVENYLTLKYGFFQHGSSREESNEQLGTGICYGIALELLTQGNNPNPLEEGFMRKARFLHAESKMEGRLAKKGHLFKYRDSTGALKSFLSNSISPSRLRKMKLEYKDSLQIDHRQFEKSIEKFRKPLMLRMRLKDRGHGIYVNCEQRCFCDQNDPQDPVTGIPVMRRFGSEKEMLRALSLYLEIEYPAESIQAMFVSRYTNNKKPPPHDRLATK